MKSVLISIKPKWVDKIASGEKTIEVRKTAPKEVPFKAYIYCTKDKPYILTFAGNGKMRVNNGMVIGEFVCDKVYSIKNQGSWFSVADEEQSVTNEIARQSCLDYDDMDNYLGNKDGYGWHISDLKIYDNPKELGEFNSPCPIENKDCENCIRYGKPYTWNFDEKNGTIYCTRRLTRRRSRICLLKRWSNEKYRISIAPVILGERIGWERQFIYA